MASNVFTRVTDKGVVMEVGTPALSIEVPVVGASPSVAVWAPYGSTTPGHHTSWADAVAAVQKMTAPTTIQIEADPWHDEVVIPAGIWDLNETTIVGKVTWAQGGRNWNASRDYGPQYLITGFQSYRDEFRGNQIKLWVHTEDGDQVTRLNGVVGLKDMFLRSGFGDDYIEGNYGAFTAYDSNYGIATFQVSGNDDTFTQADLGSFLEVYSNDTESGSGYVLGTVIEVVSDKVVKMYLDFDYSYSYVPKLNASDNGNLWWDNYDDFWGRNTRSTATFELEGKRGGRKSQLGGNNETLNNCYLYANGANANVGDSYDNFFTPDMVGKKIRISNVGDLNGEYTILSLADYYSDRNYQTAIIDMPYFDDQLNNVCWSTLGTANTFTLDNVDFRSPYTNYEALHLKVGQLWLNLQNAASVRSSAIMCDGMIVVQSKGQADWIGYEAILGSGYVKIYALPGMKLNDNWYSAWQGDSSTNISFDLYQGFESYLPENTGNWNYWYGHLYPRTVWDALDALASRVSSLENP